MSRIKTIKDVERALVLLVAKDAGLARAHEFVQSTGMEVPLRLRPGGLGGLAEIVLSQLVSKASANAIHRRFEQQISPLTPKTCLNAGEETWRMIGLSRPKQAALKAICVAMTNGILNLETLGDLPVNEAVLHLTAIKGIGTWTAEVYLLFCVGHADIFPSGDLALREAVRFVWSMDERPSDKELRTIARQWSPWRGVAARLLWACYAAKKKWQRSNA